MTQEVWVPSRASAVLLLLQGSSDWFHRVLPMLPSHCPFVFSANHGMGSPSLPPTNDVFSLQSRHAGSVIDGTWWFCSRGVPVPTAPILYHRTLHHIWNAATRLERFHPCRPTTSQDELSAGKSLAWYAGPSVFIKTGWVKQPLSVSELMQAYDLPGSIAPSFVTMPWHQLPWLLHAPLKLLVHVGGCCTSPIVDGGKFSSVVDWPEDTAGSHVDTEETVGQFSSAVNPPARPPGLGRCLRVERQASSFEGLAIANQRAATTTQGATMPIRLDSRGT
jgi:hypothetical protein